jgi:hypothetical protein
MPFHLLLLHTFLLLVILFCRPHHNDHYYSNHLLHRYLPLVQSTYQSSDSTKIIVVIEMVISTILFYLYLYVYVYYMFVLNNLYIYSVFSLFHFPCTLHLFIGWSIHHPYIINYFQFLLLTCVFSPHFASGRSLARLSSCIVNT